MHISKTSLTTVIPPKLDDQGWHGIFFLNILTLLTNDETQTGSEGLRVMLASVVTIWASATVGNQRNTYCGKTGSRKLHMPRVPVAPEHLHSSQHTRHRRRVLVAVLQTERGTTLTPSTSLQFNQL